MITGFQEKQANREQDRETRESLPADLIRPDLISSGMADFFFNFMGSYAVYSVSVCPVWGCLPACSGRVMGASVLAVCSAPGRRSMSL